MTYLIPFLNGGAEIVDPVITYPELISWDVATKTGTILALLVTPNGSKFSVEMGNIDLPTVNEGTINSKGALAIKQYEV